MRRKSLVFTVLTVSLLAAILVWAQDVTNIHELVKNADEYEAVRKVVRQEIQGWFNNDPEQVFSVFDADNFFGIATGGSNDPKEWTIYGSGRADVRAYADGIRGRMNEMPEGFRHHAEIQHVHIKGNHALTVARQWFHVPDEEHDRTIDQQFQTVWILKKSGGQWKVISLISQVSRERTVTEN